MLRHILAVKMLNFNLEMARNKKKDFFGSRIKTDGLIFSLPTLLSSSFQVAPKVSLLSFISQDKNVFPLSGNQVPHSGNRVPQSGNQVPNSGPETPLLISVINKIEKNSFTVLLRLLAIWFCLPFSTLSHIPPQTS